MENRYNANLCIDRTWAAKGDTLIQECIKPQGNARTKELWVIRLRSETTGGETGERDRVGKTITAEGRKQTKTCKMKQEITNQTRRSERRKADSELSVI